MKPIALLCLLALAPAYAQPSPQHYECRRAPKPIRVDGMLNDSAWKRAPWTTAFVDIQGAKGPKPRFQTRAKMLWDDEYFYVAADLQEPHVWATLTQHDAVIFHDNDFEVFLNPSGDTLNYFEFEINALNTGWDLFLPKPYKKGGKADNSWEIPGLRTGIGVHGSLNNPADVDHGWTVELAFPWKAFAARAPVTRPSPGDTWRVNFSRVEWQIVPGANPYKKVPNKPEDNWVWSPQGLIDMHVPEHWGHVTFVR